MKKRYLLLLFLACVCVAQTYNANTPPANGYRTGAEYWPWTQAINQACFAYVATDAITGFDTFIRASTRIVATSVSVMPDSGYHFASSHSGARPIPIMLSQSNNGFTDGTGCVTYHWSSPGNMASWVTFASISPGFSTTGINSRYRFLDWAPNGSKVPLVQYNEANGYLWNAPFTNHPDPRHNLNGIFQYIDYARWGTKASVDAMYHASVLYFESTEIALNNAVQLDILRGSNPDGGLADNEIELPGSANYVSAPWNARANEFHQLGVEWDVANPLYQYGYIAPNGSNAFSLWVSASYVNNIILGKSDPNGVPLAVDPPNDPFPPARAPWWSQQGVLHMVTSVAPKAKM